MRNFLSFWMCSYVDLSCGIAAAICYHEGRNQLKEKPIHEQNKAKRIMGHKHRAWIKPYLKFIQLLNSSVCPKSLLFIL